MIKSVIIRNFQSHKKTHLEFHQGVNVIVGATDKGKSSIMRALNWVIDNKPSGTDFRSHWGGVTSVTLTKTDGTTIKRIRSDSLNIYRVTYPTGDSQTFKGFGQGVPEEVAKIFNTGQINIHNQLDMPFLIGNSPGDISKYLNSVVNLDVIDTAVANVNLKSRRTASELKIEKARIIELKEELKNYSGLKPLEDLIKQAEIVAGKSKDDRIKVIEVTKILKNIKELDDTLNKKGDILKAAKKFKVIAVLSKQIKSSTKKKSTLELLLDSIRNTDNKIDVNKTRLEKEQSKLDKIKKEGCPVCGNKKWKI